MFEQMTYENIMAEMLERVGSLVDKREGSIIWDALAPAAYQLSLYYEALDKVLQNGFADTAEREYLCLRARERGIEPHPATYAGARARIIGAVALGQRYLCGDYGWQVERELSENEYLLRCEQQGSASNTTVGRMTPVEYLAGVTEAELLDIIEPGGDEESTEALRERYIVSLTEQSFGGNRADYIEKALTIPGVGAAKVYPAWNGGGTVKLTIISADHTPPDTALVAKVQNIFDPLESQGEGLGLAPIGHVVTAAGVTYRTVDINMTLTLAVGLEWNDVSNRVLNAVDDYFTDLTKTWAAQDHLTVRVSQLEARILAEEGIIDVSGLTLCGAAENLPLLSDEVPIRGEFNV